MLNPVASLLFNPEYFQTVGSFLSQKDKNALGLVCKIWQAFIKSQKDKELKANLSFGCFPQANTSSIGWNGWKTNQLKQISVSEKEWLGLISAKSIFKLTFCPSSTDLVVMAQKCSQSIFGEYVEVSLQRWNTQTGVLVEDLRLQEPGKGVALLSTSYGHYDLIFSVFERTLFTHSIPNSTHPNKKARTKVKIFSPGECVWLGTSESNKAGPSSPILISKTLLDLGHTIRDASFYSEKQLIFSTNIMDRHPIQYNWQQKKAGRYPSEIAGFQTTVGDYIIRISKQPEIVVSKPHAKPFVLKGHFCFIYDHFGQEVKQTLFVKQCLLFDKNGLITLAEGDSRIKAWMLAAPANKLERFVKIDNPIQEFHHLHVCLMGIYRRLLISISDKDGMIKIWDIQTGLCLESIKTGLCANSQGDSTITSLCIHPAKPLFAYGTRDGRVFVHSLTNQFNKNDETLSLV